MRHEYSGHQGLCRYCGEPRGNARDNAECSYRDVSDNGLLTHEYVKTGCRYCGAARTNDTRGDELCPSRGLQVVRPGEIPVVPSPVTEASSVVTRKVSRTLRGEVV